MAVAASAWSLAADPAFAAQSFPVDLPAGSLAGALAALGRQTGASFGSVQPLPAANIVALRGRLPTDKALRRLLGPVGWHAVAIGPNVWRLEPMPLARPPVRAARIVASAPRADAPVADIVVTATKRRERLATAPLPLAVLSAEALGSLSPAPDTGAAATLLNGLAVTNLGAGRDRLFVRGVADSPFDGFGQSSVSVQFGEARATYDAPDPDLRLVDVEQVELLKGPQGPLYGTGALGGVWRLSPIPPALDRVGGTGEITGSVTSSGAAAGSIEGVVNVPIVINRLGVRAVGYRVGQGGWIDDAGGSRHVNGGQTSGIRLELRAVPANDWTIDLNALTQLGSALDSQYVEQRGTLTRTTRAAEPQDTDFALASITAAGHLGTLQVTSVVSIAGQELQASYDAGASAAPLGGNAPATYLDDRRYTVATAETRIGARGTHVDWLAGASLLDARTDATGTLSGAAATINVLAFHRQVDELALFGEATWHLTPHLDATGGLRVFHSAIDDQRRDLGGSSATIEAAVRATPSATIAWQPSTALLIYGRYAAALRPGGTQAPTTVGGTGAPYGSDGLASFDIGARWITSRLRVDADLFRTRWHAVQADVLSPVGLVGTSNIGDAANIGVDLTAGWTPDAHWSITAGLLVQKPRLAPPGDQAFDQRLPVVPDVSSHGEIGYRVERGDWRFDAQLRAGYRGPGRLTSAPELDRRLDAIVTSGASISAARASWSLRLTVDNIADARGDTFAFGNPFTIASTEQHVPQRPRTAALSLRRTW